MMKFQKRFLCIFAAALILPLFMALFIMAPAFASDYSGQAVYKTPEEAVHALVEACHKDDTKMLIEIFGQKHEDVVNTGHPEKEKLFRAGFYKMAQEKKLLEKEKDGSITLVVGKMEWPFPIPLVKGANGWYFDTEAGKEEILNRRIGENELTVIALCRYFVKAQKEYAEIDHDGDKVNEFAQKIASAPGMRDGLYWPVDPKSGERLSPFGPLAARAREAIGDKKDSGEPYFGYYFKIFTKQGENAPGGKYDYVINGNMIGGFALMAWPAHYGKTGIMTFMVNQQGIVYEKNLGEDTLEKVKAIDEYNPDKTWKEVKEK